MAAHDIVTVEQGELRGRRRSDHVVWRGIPYAAPPVGESRWRAPHEPERWRGVRDAGSFGPQPVQPEDLVTGRPAAPSSEDCLYLNVCAPAEPAPPQGWPVLFWLHGGGFRSGSGIQFGEGRAFARAGVLVVTINYRLGALGFAHLAGVFGAAEADAGVCGLLDQVAALRWVRRNIAAFGGDPGRVTAYGVSAGAKSVANLMASPLASGLFGRAISSSGGADHVAAPEAGTALARRFLAELGDPPPDRLRALPAAAILAAQERIVGGPAATWLWRPTKHVEVLPGVPIELISRGSAAGVSLLVGNNADEAVLFAQLLGPERLAGRAREVLAGIVGADRLGGLLRAYDRGRWDPVAAAISAAGDERYGVPTQRLADAQSAHAPVFRYRADLAAPGLPERLDGGHGSEAAMVWQVPIPGVPASFVPDPGRARLSSQVHRSWLAFIRNGKPGAEDLPAWPRYEPDARPVLIFDADSHVEHDPRRDERLAWADTTWQSGTWFPATL